MHSVNYYTRSPLDVPDRRIEFIAVSKVLENLDKPDRRETVSTSFRIAVINQYGDQNCVTVDKSVWKKSRTVSLWINQFENVPCQRVRKREKPAKKRTEGGPCRRL